MSGEANVGDKRFYRESGNIIEVEVIGIKSVDMGGARGLPNPGKEYSLRTVRVVESNTRMVEEAHPEVGKIFTVARADVGGHYAGWSLTDRL